MKFKVELGGDFIDDYKKGRIVLEAGSRFFLLIEKDDDIQSEEDAYEAALQYVTDPDALCVDNTPVEEVA